MFLVAKGLLLGDTGTGNYVLQVSGLTVSVGWDDTGRICSVASKNY